MTAKSSQQHAAAQTVTQPATQEQILALLGKLNDKLLPLPAPKTERVKRGQVECLAPFYELRESMQKKDGSHLCRCQGA